MLAELHSEMAYLSALGYWLDCSGWVAAITNSEIAKGGVVESFLSDSKVSKTRYAHQVTLCALEILLKRAYNEEALTQPFKERKRNKENKYPQFKFWSLTPNMEMLLLRFVRSLRFKNFKIFVESLEEMLPFFFVLDHLNYVRWLSVHLKNLKSLSSTNPTICAAFLEENFVVTKTLVNFASIPIDYAHEQNNKLVKEDDGTMGLTENTAELTRWMIRGPELARIVNEFEEKMPSRRGSKAIYLHHKKTKSFQDNFGQHVLSLVSMMEELENPFLENDEILVYLDTKDIAENIANDTVNNIELVGELKSQEFFIERLVKKTKSIDDTLHKNNLPLFSYKPPLQSKHSSDISILKENVKLFSQLYVANQQINCDIGDFFFHENSSVPPSLCKDGKFDLEIRQIYSIACMVDVISTIQSPLLQLKVQFSLICTDLQGREHLRNTMKNHWNYFFKRN